MMMIHDNDDDNDDDDVLVADIRSIPWQTLTHLDNHHPHQSLHAIIQAVTTSHSLLFEPSMIPQLYMQWDHRAAIYAPFFLPVTVKVISSLVSFYRGRRQRKE